MNCIKPKAVTPIMLLILSKLFWTSVAFADIAPLSSIKSIAAIFYKADSVSKPNFIGTGILINTNGQVLTAKHVLENAPSGADLLLSLGTKSGPHHAVLDTNCASNKVDICLLHIASDIAKSEGIEADELYRPSCYAPPTTNWKMLVAGYTGFPGAPVLQRTGSTSVGFAVPQFKLYATEVQLIPGMSGGPVFDRFYKIIGVIHGADEASRNLGLFTPLFTAKSLIGNTGIDCPVEPDELSDLIPVRFSPKPRLIDFRTLLSPNENSKSDIESAPTVVSVESLSYSNIQDPGPKARISTEKLILEINDKTFEFQEFQRVNIGTDSEDWLLRVGDPKGVTIDQGVVVAHSTMFKPKDGSFSWARFKQFIRSGATIKGSLSTTVSWKFQSETRESEITVECDPSPREEDIARSALVDFEDNNDSEDGDKSASRLQIFCRDAPG